MNWFEYGALFALAAIASMMLIPLCKRLAFKVDAIDYPSARRVNKQPIPRLGGIAIFASVFLYLGLFLIGIQIFDWDSPFDSQINYPLAISGIVFMFLVGVVDDIVQLRARYKLLGQIIAACIVVASGLLISKMHNPFASGYIYFGPMAYPITVFYLVAFANIINLIDGLDGLAAGISTISALTIFTFAIITHRYDAAFFSIILAGACVGFLRYNFNPASIFMGDSGSLFLGFSLGTISLLAIARSAFVMSVMIPVLAAGIPVLDTAAAILRRMRAHQSIGMPDKGHIHHRLIDSGFSQRKTVLIMWGLSFVLAVSSIIITETSGILRILFVIVIAGMMFYIVLKLHLLEPILRHHYHPKKKAPSADQQSSQHPDQQSNQL